MTADTVLTMGHRDQYTQTQWLCFTWTENVQTFPDYKLSRTETMFTRRAKASY